MRDDASPSLVPSRLCHAMFVRVHMIGFAPLARRRYALEEH